MLSTFSSKCKKWNKRISLNVELFLQARCFELALTDVVQSLFPNTSPYWEISASVMFKMTPLIFQLVPANQFHVCWHDDHLPALLTWGLNICLYSTLNHILTPDSFSSVSFPPGGGRNCGVHELICARRGKATLQPSVSPYLSVSVSIWVHFLFVFRLCMTVCLAGWPNAEDFYVQIFSPCSWLPSFLGIFTEVWRVGSFST